MGHSQNTRASRFEPQTEHLIEEGEAFRQLAGIDSVTAAQPIYDVIVVGAGQAGLSVGYHLAKRGLRFVILDANSRIGDSWRKRWDSLRLFTPARYDGLDGMPFPAPGDSFPTKDEMGDFLEAYASRFNLPVRNGFHVNRLFKRNARFVVAAGDIELEAHQVVVAMTNYQQRRVPDCARDLRADIVQIHSSDYRSPSMLRPGGVLIVGAGNSGSEIAMELVRSHKTWMSGRDTGHVPFRINGFWGRNVLLHIVLRLVFHYILTIRTPLGRKARPRILSKGGALIRVKPKDLESAGVVRVPRLAGIRDGLPLLEDGRVLDVTNVIWSTGYHANFSWIELPILDNNCEPIHQGGIVGREPGLCFVGLHFLYAMSSTMIHGVGRDAARIVKSIAKRANTSAIERRRVA